MRRGEKRPEATWKNLILNYLNNHKEENNTIKKIAIGIGTTSQTATKYIFLYLGGGLIGTELKVVNTVTFKITNKGLKELKEEII